MWFVRMKSLDGFSLALMQSRMLIPVWIVRYLFLLSVWILTIDQG